MAKNTYYFPPVGVEETGFHDSLIYNFTGDTLYNLTRESIQNIVDAKDPTSFEPTIAEFELFDIAAKSLPEYDSLREIFAACWRHEKEDKSYDGIEFFKKAYDLLNENKLLHVLKISDYNTTGLYGDDEDRDGAYYKLMRISGSSNKSGAMGGSYGLGKGAYFKPSLFRTIFVSSVWEDNKMVFQGKLRLVSHEGQGGLTDGIGFFAYPAIRTAKEIPDIFKRTEKGTSVFIIGFEESAVWKRKMAESVLRYFWLAIIEGQLEVKIGDMSIDQKNVEEKILEYFSKEKGLDKFNPIPFYKTYKEVTPITSNLRLLGNVELRILLDKDFPRRIEYFRNTGMVIQNKQHQSGKGFAGVFTCQDRNGILRMMEDPTHSRWSKDVPMTSNEDEKKMYAEAEKELKDFIEQHLGELTTSTESTTSTIKDLDKYFYSPAEDNNIDSDGNPESIEGQIIKEETGSIIRGEDVIGKQSKINIQVKIPTVVPGEPEGQGEGGGDDGDGRGGGPGTGHPDEDGQAMIKVNKDIQFKRSFVLRKGNNIEHVVLVSGGEGERFDAEVRVGTEDSFDTIDIKEALDDSGNEYKIDRIYDKNNEVKSIYVKGIIIPKTGNLKLKIIFNVPGRFALNLRAYENK